MTGSRDLKRFNALREMGCICCLTDLNRKVEADVHHLVDKGYRRLSGGHQATIPLCPWHHRGVVKLGCDDRYMRSMFGPSMALEKREFIKCYGSERVLLAKVNELLNEKAHES